MRATDGYRENAARCRADADAAVLDNVRDRNLRAEAAWLAMAERQERVDNARMERESAVTSARINMEST
jgi:hypothetical protein